MIAEGKFRAIQKEFEAGLEVEGIMEHRMARGSEEWLWANQFLQYTYELMGAMFQRIPLYQSLSETAIKESE